MFRFALPALVLVAIATQTEAQNAGKVCKTAFQTLDNQLKQETKTCKGNANVNECVATAMTWTTTDGNGVVTLDTNAVSTSITASLGNLPADQQTAITDRINTCMPTNAVAAFDTMKIMKCLGTTCANAAKILAGGNSACPATFWNLNNQLKEEKIVCKGNANVNECVATAMLWTTTDGNGVVTLDTNAVSTSITVSLGNLPADQQTAITNNINNCMPTNAVAAFDVNAIIKCINKECKNAAKTG